MPSDVLEQAHLAMLRGHLEEARAALDALVAAEPDNAEAQRLRATVIVQQAARARAMPLETPGFVSAPPSQTDPTWVRPPFEPIISTPRLFQPERRWPRSLRLTFCLLVALFLPLVPHTYRPTNHDRYRRRNHDWRVSLAIGEAACAVQAIRILAQKRQNF